MAETNTPTAQDLKAIVDAADVGPSFFTREDGTPMAVMTEEFYDMIKAVYNEATAEATHPDHDIFDLQEPRD
jgi:hypothetical protein